MSRNVRVVIAAATACLALAAPLASPQPATAGLIDRGCGLIGTIGEGWMGKACKVVAHPKKVVGIVKTVVGGAGKRALSPSGALGIAAIVAWAVGGAHFVLSETATLIGHTTSPELTAAWFSSVYWRVAAVAVLLTLPFLCAAAIQAILRSDGALLARAVFGYLPLSFLATAIAAPLAMLLLQLTDWMGASVAQAAGDQGSHFLGVAGVALGTLGVAAGSPFVTFLIATLTAAGGLILWLELLVREAAVYVVVLMLPLVFTAMVWPARRVWAVRSVEVLVALILAKFAIVSVLALAAAALGHSGGSLIVKSLAGLVLVILGAFAPWALLRLLPLAEVASAAAGHVREHAQSRLTNDVALGRRGLASVGDNVSSLMGRMHAFSTDATEAAMAPPTREPRSHASAASHDRGLAHNKVAAEPGPGPTGRGVRPTPHSPSPAPETVSTSGLRSVTERRSDSETSTGQDQPRIDHDVSAPPRPDAPAPGQEDPPHGFTEPAALGDEHLPNLPPPELENRGDE